MGLTVTKSVTDAAIHKKINIWNRYVSFGLSKVNKINNFGWGNEDHEIKSLKESGLVIKGVSEIIKNEAKKQEGAFLKMLLGTLGASLVGNLLTGTGTIRASEDTVRAGQDF